MKNLTEMLNKATTTKAEDAFEAEAPGEAPLPAAPAQFSMPVGPPPPEVALPDTYEGYIELAKKVSRGAMTDKANLWIQLAQAAALKEIADQLGDLLMFLGARDEAGEEPMDEGPRFGDQITNGIVGSVLVANDELLPPGAVDLFKVQLASKLAEVMSVPE